VSAATLGAVTFSPFTVGRTSKNWDPEGHKNPTGMKENTIFINPEIEQVMENI
jgi:hypothetical protein